MISSLVGLAFRPSVQYILINGCMLLKTVHVALVTCSVLWTSVRLMVSLLSFFNLFCQLLKNVLTSSIIGLSNSLPLSNTLLLPL